MSDVLIVYLREQRVGRLWVEGGRFAFEYDEAWLASDASVPLSLRLPLQTDVFDDNRARPFFANLLLDARQAMGQLAHHRMRTALTLLGMVFGVGAVIAMLAVSEGGKREALELIYHWKEEIVALKRDS